MADAKWYVVHTQTGVETKARASLISHAETAGLSHLIHEVLIPLGYFDLRVAVLAVHVRGLLIIVARHPQLKSRSHSLRYRKWNTKW